MLVVEVERGQRRASPLCLGPVAALLALKAPGRADAETLTATRSSCSLRFPPL